MGGLAKYNIAELLSDQGLYDEAEPLLRDVLRVWRASGAETDAAEAKRELGKLMTRRGDVETAHELLLAARLQQVHAGQQNEVLTTDFRLAELLVMRRASSEALAFIDDLLPRIELLGASVLIPGLLRAGGLALLQAGRLDEAREQLDDARLIAQAGGDLFEVTLALQTLIALAKVDSGPVDELEAELQGLLERLGIVALPPLPLGSRPSAVTW